MLEGAKELLQVLRVVSVWRALKALGGFEGLEGLEGSEGLGLRDASAPQTLKPLNPKASRRLGGKFPYPKT